MPLVGADRPHGLEVERVAEAEPVENTRRVRPEIDAAARLGKLRRLLADVDVEGHPWRSATAAVRPPIPAPMTAILSDALVIYPRS